MRILLFLNNWGGWQTAKWLCEQHEDIVGLVIPESDQKYAQQILAAVNMVADRIWTAPQLRMPDTVSRIRDLNPEIGISAWFGYVLKPDILQILSKGCINLHAANLPWNGGWHTNVWPILDGSPAGVTIHYIDEGIDTGDIIAQRPMPVDPTDTGSSLHQKLTCELLTLFKETWPLIKAGKHTRTPQDHALATYHRRKDLTAVDCIQLNRQYPARELLNILRARTYPPYPSAYFIEKSQRIYVRVQLLYEEERDFQGMPERVSRKLECIDLDRRYEARELLEILRGQTDSPHPSAYFVHESRRIYVRSQLLGEHDIDLCGIPEWMATTK